MNKTLLKSQPRKFISLYELKSCPQHIFLLSHWNPTHKVDECGVKLQEEKLETKITKKMYSKTDYNDVDLICICGKSFIWLAGEQEFINNLFANGKIKEIIEPKRCPACRKKKKDHFNKSN